MITTTLDMAGLDGGRVQVTPGQLSELRAQIRGSMLHAGDEGWDAAVRIWNAMITRTPALVIQVSSANDVAAAVRFAANRGLLIGIKGGGHNIAGTAIAEGGLVLDMSRLNDISVDPQAKLAIVGPGCRLQDVDRATQAHSLATVLGFISEVGVTGLALGGGLGYLTRRFGWTVDNLESVQIVTADGEVRVADRNQNSDLFWALRGGGGNFGVVTRLTFRLHDVGPTVYGGLIGWPFERADAVFGAYRAITSSAPPELAVWLALLYAPPAPFVPDTWHHKPLCAMAICYTGDLTKTDGLLAPVRRLGNPVVDLLREQPYTEVQSYLDPTEPKGMHYYWKTEYLADLSVPLLTTLRDVYADGSRPGLEIGVLHLAGALNAHGADDGAVGNRDARFVIGVKGMWDGNERNASSLQQWIRTAWQRLRPFSTGATYINFQTEDEDDARIRATYGANYPRLVEIKKKYDPRNVFRVNRNILVE